MRERSWHIKRTDESDDCDDWWYLILCMVPIIFLLFSTTGTESVIHTKIIWQLDSIHKELPPLFPCRPGAVRAQVAVSIFHCNILLAEAVTKLQYKSPLYFIPLSPFEKRDVSLWFIASSDTGLIRTPLAMHGCTNAMDDSSFNNPSLKLFASQTRIIHTYARYSCFNSGWGRRRHAFCSSTWDLTLVRGVVLVGMWKSGLGCAVMKGRYGVHT